MMPAFVQRGRSQRPSAGRFDGLSPSRLASASADSDSDSDDSDGELTLPMDGPLAAALKQASAPVTADVRPRSGIAATEESPPKGGLLRRLGALRRSVSPAKKRTTGASGSKQSPQKSMPDPGSSGDVTAAETAAPALAQPQQTSSRLYNTRPLAACSASATGRDPQGAQPSGVVDRTAHMPQHAHSAGKQKAAQEAPPHGRTSLVRQNSAAPRLPENGSHHATAAAVAAAGIARSGSDASSLATETTVASGVSSGLGNARTAADSYGGSVFASALNQEAGLQLLSQVRRFCTSQTEAEPSEVFCSLSLASAFMTLKCDKNPCSWSQRNC